MHIHARGWHDHEATSNDPTWVEHPWQLWDFTQREKGMDAMNAQCLEWGTYTMDEFLAPKILDLFEKPKGISHAHGMRAPCGDASISTL
jgi:hypothetical protein